MSAVYDLFENPPAEDGAQQPLHARIVLKGTVGQEEFLDRVHKFTGISRSLLAGAMEAFANETCDLLANGWNVELGKLGFFSASLQCPPVYDKKKVRASSVKLKSINFRASRVCRREVGRQMRLQRRETSPQSKQGGISRPTCIERLAEYFKTHLFISRTSYCLLTGRNKRCAIADLNAFIAEGIIRREGLGKLSIYCKSNVFSPSQ
ncbi:MAG TPA: DNA-binding protein [Bacteroides reticulotermitis]|nr:DNA-binding protein [Bacteroides reticulotermitis]